jgi:flavodoxin
MKTVVAYYSRTGHTKFISEKIAQQLGADLCEILDKKKREGRIGFFGGGGDALREKLTDIEVSKPIEGYDFVIIGTPVWAGKITPAIRKFMVTNDFKEKTVALFVTLDGNKPEKSLDNMKAAITAKRIAGESGFIRPMGDQEKTEQQVKTWCSELEKVAKA